MVLKPVLFKSKSHYCVFRWHSCLDISHSRILLFMQVQPLYHFFKGEILKSRILYFYTAIVIQTSKAEKRKLRATMFTFNSGCLWSFSPATARWSCLNFWFFRIPVWTTTWTYVTVPKWEDVLKQCEGEAQWLCWSKNDWLLGEGGFCRHTTRQRTHSQRCAFCFYGVFEACNTKKPH